LTDKNLQQGFAAINGAKIYYELAGAGQTFVMIHAGVADSRQWNAEFAYYANHYRVLRFDMRGYGKSEPVDGEFNIQDDLLTLLDHLNLTEPLILMGCSMGAGLAIDFTLAYPERVKALIIVDGGPSGLELDTEKPALFEAANKADEAEDWDLMAEIETQIWFDGQNRSSEQINPEMRKLALEMNRLGIAHYAKKLGKHVRKETAPAVERLDELSLPTLLIVGENDIPYLLAVADYLETHLANATKVRIPNAAHLPNMDQAQLFQEAVDKFLLQSKA